MSLDGPHFTMLNDRTLALYFFLTVGDIGFLLFNIDTFWADLFVRQFVHSNDLPSDDLLFFVRRRLPRPSSSASTFRTPSLTRPRPNMEVR